MHQEGEPEIPLEGGDTTPVVRVGRTVRRRAGPWTPTIQALLAHVRSHGFAEAPEPLGLDAQGRESVGFLEGETVRYPLPDWIWQDEVLSRVAALLRRYHDSAATFVPPPDAVWQWAAHEPFEVICHKDFAPYNIVFDAARPVGVIDFDTASPGPRLWDLAYTAYRFVPLTAPKNPDTTPIAPAEQLRRLDLFCTAYGGTAAAPVLRTAVEKLGELMNFITTRAAAGDPAQAAVLARGDVAIYAADRSHVEALRARLESS